MERCGSICGVLYQISYGRSMSRRRSCAYGSFGDRLLSVTAPDISKGVFRIAFSVLLR